MPPRTSTGPAGFLARPDPLYGLERGQAAREGGIMGKERMAAVTDGVLAVVITIMVLDLKAPETTDLSALGKLLPTFLSYVLSFVYVAIYWNNHHHLLAACERVNGAVLWANMHLLFWLSLIPFTTAWLAENHFEPVPTLLYGVSLLMPALAYWILARTLVAAHGSDSVLARAMGGGFKERPPSSSTPSASRSRSGRPPSRWRATSSSPVSG